MSLETALGATVFHFTVNGVPAEVTANGGRRLLDVLREDLGLMGTKEGCGEGECGACSVLLDGKVVNSCLVPVCQVDGRQVLTVEGLARNGRPDALQSAFVDMGAAQCGFCTPGMLLAGRAFLESGVRPTDLAIREAIAGNLCRCTGYTKIVEAIELAAAGHIAEPSWQWPQTAERDGDGTPADGRGRRGPAAVSPRTLPEALRLLREHEFRPVAGGTDLMVALAAGGTDGPPLLDLSKLTELRGIHLSESGGLVLGGLSTYAAIRRSPIVAEHLPVLAEMAATVGAAQIQNRGTLGGNIANASPAGDSLPVLLATDATIVLGGVDGERRCPAAEFFTGYRRTLRHPAELILRIEIPLPPGRVTRYRKVGTRQALAISKVVLAASWRPDAGIWRDVRVAVGSVAPVPMRAHATEAVLEGGRPTRETAERAAAAIASEIVPIDDVRSTASYRRAVTARILRRIVRDAGGW